MLFTAIIFIAILAILVLAHELGHFVTARMFGCKVEEFGFGFPPRIGSLWTIRRKELKKIGQKENIRLEVTDYKTLNGPEIIEEKIIDQITEVDREIEVVERHLVWGNKDLAVEPGDQVDTVYSFNWIPLGGFVKIKGEDGDNRQEADSFGAKKVWQRAIILSAGVLMNLFLAVVILSLGFGLGLPQSLPVNLAELKGAKVRDVQTQILMVLDGGPAAAAGVQMGDTILKIDNQSFGQVADIQNYLNQQVDQPVFFELKRGDQVITQEVVPTFRSDIQRGGIGVGLVQTGLVSYPWYQAIVKGVQSTGILIKMIVVAFYDIIKDLVGGQKPAVEVSGPVGIAVLTGQVARMGFIYILQFIALLSINLAIINFIPFPALDGGRCLFLIIEKIRRKPVNQRLEAVVHNIGFLLLMLLIVVVTYHDVVKFGGGLWQKVFG
ncbi:MAG: RIP metalloprotease RseP [Patescibacteria group bacterium]